MSLTKSWYTYDEAASKYGLSTKQLQKWVEDGLIRTEESKGHKVILLNGDDIELELQLIPSV